MKRIMIYVSKIGSLVILVNWKMKLKSYFETGSTSLTPHTHRNLVIWDLFDVLQAGHTSKYHPNLEALNRLAVPMIVAKQS